MGIAAIRPSRNRQSLISSPKSSHPQIPTLNRPILNPQFPGAFIARPQSILKGMPSRLVSLRLTVASLGLLALVPVHPAAQQFVLSSQDRARLIAVDFAVVGADSQPVADLRADEVTLKIDGRARPIRSLEYVSLASAPAGDSGAGPDTRLAPYGTNATSDGGRSVILILDQYTVRPGRDAGVKEQVNQFLRLLGPRDRVALMTMPYGGLTVDLTTEHHRISQALTRIGGQAPPNEGAEDASCRTSATLAALRGTLDELRGGEAPVAIVFFSAQLSVPTGPTAAPSPSPAMRLLAPCPLRTEQFKQVGAAAASARAQFYVVQPELSVTDGGRAGLEHLTGATGGPLLHLGVGADSALARVARETSGYYIARIEPEPSETIGTVRNFSLSVTRPDATVRQRPQLSVMRTAARFVNTSAPTPLDMMKDARVFRDLPLRITGFSSREPGGQMIRVVALFDSPDESAAPSSAIVGLFNDQGKLVASTQLGPAELTASPVASSLVVPAGHYRLRVAATESSGRGGAADAEINAELSSAGPLTMSALVVGLSREGRFQPRLDFGREASAMAYVEIYGARQGAAVGAVFEVARTANGPALVTIKGTFAATSEPDRFVVTAAVPVGALTSGDYVVRAIVAAQDQPGGRVLRAIRKK